MTAPERIRERAMSARPLPPTQRRVRIPMVPEDADVAEAVARLRGAGSYWSTWRWTAETGPTAVERHAQHAAAERMAHDRP
ncbi:hypothetical protein IU443_07470 [Nocardia farcinica]|uniref:hypothetical protein n=1 Tax=Nocardia farcinica TaxID=37329 RepID=UPI000E022F3F|nr:hypothetical protein [Nocardia farcinica]MBA4857094.1 hypothetical protein [Nocardia farcinica]MBC9817171.1 hypothetical protein [Nocardia farcinica]MBF6138695.1 hypothetical protein [Nocardia farcinica]MBF6262713.1 hypothetical protein [Nocardia farcinica]MBF6281217.1 hypothetical protein [Nocardia farcinica]